MVVAWFLILCSMVLFAVDQINAFYFLNLSMAGMLIMLEPEKDSDTE